MHKKEQLIKIRECIINNARPMYIRDLSKKVKIPENTILDLFNYDGVTPQILEKKYNGKKCMVSLNKYGLSDVDINYKIDLIVGFYRAIYV